jgi:hypothetical protein
MNYMLPVVWISAQTVGLVLAAGLFMGELGFWSCPAHVHPHAGGHDPHVLTCADIIVLQDGDEKKEKKDKKKRKKDDAEDANGAVEEDGEKKKKKKKKAEKEAAEEDGAEKVRAQHTA